ncbi:general odorant-binding protein 56h-like [Haematobia irritans]|uniref:general odorant-binding protein 56h-like n=1 Tax=Haematobia irritans TaxID=7368 RepID=UPI003F50C6F8
MKLISSAIVLVLVVLSVVKADLNEERDKVHAVCAEESKATPEELNAFFGMGMPEEHITDAIKCHVKCVMEQNGYYNDGSLNPENVLKSIEVVPSLHEHMDDIAAAIESCKNEKGNDECDTAFKLMTCFHNTEGGKMAQAAMKG